MNSKSKLINAIINGGALRVASLGVELIEADEEAATWRVYLKRDVPFIWGGVGRTLPAGTALGKVETYPEDGEISVDIPFKFLENPERYIYPVERLEREMLDAE